MVNIVIAGCGSITLWRHAPECQSSSNINLLGFYDINVERAGEFAAKWGGKVYESYEAVLADDQVDGIIIATANKFHCDMTVSALKAGKHVMCEKPMAMSIEEATLMVNTAKECNKKLMIAQSQRTDAVNQKLKEMLADEELGKVLSFRTAFCNGGPDGWSIDKGKDNWFFDKARAGYGALGDLGVHKIDLVRYILADEIKSVMASVNTLTKRDSQGNLIEHDDTSLCILEFKSGVVGTVEASWAHFGRPYNELSFFCENGTVEAFVDYPEPMVRVNYANGKMLEEKVTPTQSFMAELFAESIANDTVPAITGEDGLMAITIVDKCIESSKKGIRVEL